MEEHHLIGLDRSPCAGPDVGVGLVFEVDQVFGKVDLDWLIDDEAKGAAGGVLDKEDNAAKVDARIDIGARYQKTPFFQLGVRGVFFHHYLPALSLKYWL
jgi:hypothetical protein